MSGLVLSLFPGIGMLDHAFELEGFCVVRGPDLLWGGDIKRFHPPAGHFEGVIGGPPCQAFSRLREGGEARDGLRARQKTPGCPVKRTPLRRGPPPKRRTWLKRFGKRAKRDRESGRVFGPLCDYVRAMPCAVCGKPGPSDPHHVRSRGAGFGDWIDGAGNVVPLCRVCHDVRHACGGPGRLPEIAREIGERFKEREAA